MGSKKLINPAFTHWTNMSQLSIGGGAMMSPRSAVLSGPVHVLTCHTTHGNPMPNTSSSSILTLTFPIPRDSRNYFSFL